MAISQKDIEAARRSCGNCKGGPHKPRFFPGEKVELRNDDEKGQVVTIDSETFPHYFRVIGKQGEYCETCFSRRHNWRSAIPWDFCGKCGIVKRADGKNKPCKGPARIAVRAPEGGQ
jgi:hypothetical protein